MAKKAKDFPLEPIAGMIVLVILGCAVSPFFRAAVSLVFMLLVAGAIILAGLAIYWVLRDKKREESEYIEKLSRPRISVIEPPDPPKIKRYAVKKSILTRGEVNFHKCLQQAVPEAPIFPKMRVADVIDAKERYNGDFSRISQKHFDWVLCHPVSHEPLIAIELDDSSHIWSEKQRQNDKVKSAVAEEAGLRLIRFEWQRAYDIESIRNQISDALDQIADKQEIKTSTNRHECTPEPQIRNHNLHTSKNEDHLTGC